VMLSVLAGGTAPLNYQWQFRGQPLLNANGPALTVANVSRANAGAYAVLITNPAGAVLSESAAVSLLGNHPPVAEADGLLVRQDDPTIIDTLLLLANDRDPDGDAIIVSGVRPSSNPQAAVTLATGRITYAPAPGFTGPDWFTYSLEDNGGGTATGRVEVLVFSGFLPGSNHLTMTGPFPACRLRYAGAPGRTCEIQRSPNLNQWEILLKTQIPPHGIVEHIDLAPPTAGAYYRAIQK
jgi:Bacterial Ig domain